VTNLLILIFRLTYLVMS